MNAERWSRIRELFDVAVELSEPERAGYLLDHTGGDADLRERVERLLVADQEEETPVEAAGPAVIELLQPAAFLAEVGDASVDPYRIVRPIGRGGMGAVYLAERSDGAFDRTVALKLVHAGFDSDEVLRRFHAERRILASLDHPNIARMYDAGLSSDGRPFLVMEHVPGEPIQRYVEQHDLDPRARTELFVHVCDAVAYAHRVLVIHRDLKPSNILVRPDGSVKLLDFGIAKLADGDTEPETRTGFRLLTPEYASPEQLRGEVLSTATDVYSLGAVLYELLTGRRPFADAQTALAHAFSGSGAGLAIPPPSQANTSIQPDTPSADRATPRFARELRGDLDRIVLKALSWDRTERYESVSALADDLRRHLDGRPVLARPPSLRYRAGRFVRRHRVGVGATAIAVVGLVGSTWAAVFQARRASTERDTAVGVSAFLEELFASSDPRGGQIQDSSRVIDFIESAADRVRSGLSDRPPTQARLLYVLGSITRNLSRSDLSVPLLEDAVRTNRIVHGPGHLDEIQARELLAMELAEAGSLDVGLAQLDTALALERAARGPDTRLSWRLRERLAQAYATAQRNEEALPHVEAVVGATRAADPFEPARLGSALNLYGSVLSQLGRQSDAAVALAEAADTWAMTGPDLDEGPRALDEGVTRNNLAAVLMRLNRLEEAEAQSRSARELLRQRLPARHAAVARADIGLAEILAARWRETRDAETQAEADLLFRSGVALGRQIPELNRSRFFHLTSYGGSLRSWDQLARAEEIYAEAIEAGTETLGPEHPLTLTALSDLGRVMAQRGQIDEGLARTEDALEALTASVGTESPPRVNAAANHARVLLLAGRTDEAALVLESALEGATTAFPAGHPMISAIEALLTDAR